MFLPRTTVLPVIFIITALHSNAQFTDTTSHANMTYDSLPKIDWKSTRSGKEVTARSFLLPGVLIAYGLTSMGNHNLKSFNTELREEVYEEHPHKKVSIDNYLQFAPAIAVYGLNAAGISGKHNLKDRSMLLLLSNVIVNATVYGTKKWSYQLRPDGSAHNSFPSGHTAEAFANAEFMRLEYKDVSPMYAVAGYAMAAMTGYLRMYNNRHWFSDIVAGAGVGIASTRAAYWLYPKIRHTLGYKGAASTIILPTYQSGNLGLGLVHRF